MVPSGIPDDYQSIPLLEKFHNSCDKQSIDKLQDKINQYIQDEEFHI